MNIHVNGTPHQTSEEVDLETLIATTTGHAPPTGTAAAVNGELITRKSWNSTLLKDGDSVEILQAVAGG